MSRNIIIAFLLLICNNQVKAQHFEKIVIGNKYSLRSKILNEDREYWISLPDSYDMGYSNKRYPVLVVLDGNIHFKSIAAMVDYMSSDLYRSWKIPEMIVVAIKNVDRRRDYTPDKVITIRENNTGGGERFLRFLEDELMAEIDKNYRTEPFRILFGHSLGGLLATHAYMKKETVFNAFIAVDPSFGTWDAATMNKKLDTLTDKSFDRYYYIASANWGKRNIGNRDRHLKLFDALNNKCDGEFNAKLDYFEEENHQSVPPVAFIKGISSIFDGYGISFRDVESKEHLTQHFGRISNRLSWNICPPEQLVNQIAYHILRNNNEKDYNRALEFFILNTENYPDSYNAYDSLGEAYETFGDYKKAIENYKKSLELNPKNENAKTRLDKLKNR